MSYQVLARKWRPKDFREMVGQQHVLRALVNALDTDRLHHAYLFTGTRGVGKTTIARILAKCLNCEEGVSSQPCGKCSSCLEIAEGRSVDLIEVDAASRTKVEDTRELLENVQYAPTRSRYKVYLIDEVHMLSGHSFNALLKTLEEPPPHVKFLLATTDPQKLPVTVLSRCLQFNLKNMPPEQVVGHLREVLAAENVGFDEASLWLLGNAAAGSMRDALSLTDQAIAYGSGSLQEADVRGMLGSVELKYLYDLLQSLAADDAPGLLNTVGQMAEHATDFDSSLDELISMLHRVAVAQAVPDAVDNSRGDAERVSQLAGALTAEDAQLFYQLAINGKRDLGLASNPRSGFEMILLRMVAFRPSAVIDESVGPGDLAELAPVTSGAVAEEVDPPAKKPQPAPGASANNTVERTVSTSETGSARAVTGPGQASTSQSARPSIPRQEQGAEAASVKAEGTDHLRPMKPSGQAEQGGRCTPDPAEITPDDWHLLVEELGLTGIVYTIALNTELRSCAEARFEFVLDGDNAALFNDGHRRQIESALGQHFDTALVVSLEIGEVIAETPAQRQARLRRERQQAAEATLESDPVLQKLISRFDGELDRSSITPVDP